MTTSVKLSAPVAERLQTQADKVHQPLDALVEQMLIDSLPVYETNGFHATTDAPVDDDFPTLEEIVAMIKATPPNPNAVHLPTKTAAELIAELEADPPEPSDITPAEWDRLWAAFEAELKAADYADALSEGRL